MLNIIGTLNIVDMLESNEDKIKKYREDNKNKIKKYYEDNKEKVKKYYQDNVDKILENKKKYREKNKCEHNKEYGTCKICNIQLYLIHLQRIHLRNCLKNTNIKTYDVETVSLLDLLNQYNAPKIIDFLSIDTEGCELKILKSLDHKKFKFKYLTCEHNYQDKMRVNLKDYLQSVGYQFHEENGWDDIYIHTDCLIACC